MKEVKSRLVEGKRYLVYVMPVHYIMQGLIADTGSEWKLYKHHHTISMITDWIIHPFRHLRQGHNSMHEGHQSKAASQHSTGVTRRLIFLEIENASPLPYGAFSIGAKRRPLFMADIEFHNLKLLQIRDLPPRTGWNDLPTPVF